MTTHKQKIHLCQLALGVGLVAMAASCGNPSTQVTTNTAVTTAIANNSQAEAPRKSLYRDG